ncbi:oxidase cueO precursor, partial [Aureobasidium sp. EXF-3399]
ERLPIPSPKDPKTVFHNPNGTAGDIRYYEIEIKEVFKQIYPPPFKKARFVGYDGMTPGPTLVQEKDTEAIVRFINRGDRASSIHLHGSFSRSPFDGYADDVTEVGQYKDYYYPNRQNARTLWYHDHAVDHTAENAYYGQAGFYILHDDHERSLNLPSGAYDVPLALAARFYNQDGTLWDPEANEEKTSVHGDVIHVNGAPWPFMDVEARKTYKIYMELESKPGIPLPFTVVGSDTGFLEKSVSSSDLYIGVAERWEIVIDFSDYAGKNIIVKNTPGIAADNDFAGTDRIMQFRVGSSDTVTDSITGNGPVPSALRTVDYPPPKTGIDHSLVFQQDGGLWNINGATWSTGAAHPELRVLAKPKRGSIEIWELINKSGGWSHPIHIHLIDFQVISRTGGSRGIQPYEKVALKDVVWLGPNERVQVIARYQPWDGVYMFHCHNLIHEDHEMLVDFNVTALADFNYTEKTHFIDPMDPTYRAKPILSNEYVDVLTWGKGEFSLEGVKNKTDWFASLEAYRNYEEVKANLEQYWGRTTLLKQVLGSMTWEATFSTRTVRPGTLATLPEIKHRKTFSKIYKIWAEL